MKKPERIPLSVPRIEGNAWKYVKDCLDSEWVSSVGLYVNRFEESLARYTGARHAVAGVNGTACLHTALKLLGVGPGDAVLVPALTFIATANAVAYCGAACVFLDCDDARYNLDLDRLEEFLKKYRGPRLKAIVPTHILGYPVDMPRLLKIAKRWDLKVLEDAAESVGSFLGGRHTGTFGDAGVLSFNGNKIVTCGGGGMILTGDAALARRARHLTTQAKASPAEYIHDEIGYNYRLTNLAAALGLSQMERLKAFLRKRETISGWYRKRLKNFEAAPIGPGVQWNRWLMGVETSGPKEKNRLLKELNAAGCESRPLWAPVPRQRPYQKSLCAPIVNAERAYETVVNIPSSTSLTEAQVDRVARILKSAEIRRLLL